jgi:hypothetical protein
MKKKTIPTIIGLILLLIVLFAGVWLSAQTTTLGSRASGDCDPIGVQVTNLTHHSLDFSFITKSSCNSVLLVNNRTYQNFIEISTTHYFRVDNLTDNTEYQMELIVNGKNIDFSELKIKTGARPIGADPTSNLAWGRVINSDKTPVSSSIVYISLVGALPLSAFTDIDGRWNISLANSFSDKKNNWFTPEGNQTEDIFVYSPNGEVTQISHNTAQNDPVPDIIVGQNYFLEPTIASEIPLYSGPSNDVSPEIKLEVKNPQEKETIYNLKPLFFGEAPANSSIEIKLESDPVYNDQITTQNDGSWNWSPPQNLAPGLHTITLSYRDLKTGIIKTAKRNFYVEAASNNLAFSASPSATIRPIATLIPTSIPTIRTSHPSTSSGVPVTAFPLPAILLIISSFTFVLFSMYYYKRDD